MSPLPLSAMLLDWLSLWVARPKTWVLGESPTFVAELGDGGGLVVGLGGWPGRTPGYWVCRVSHLPLSLNWEMAVDWLWFWVGDQAEDLGTGTAG